MKYLLVFLSIGFPFFASCQEKGNAMLYGFKQTVLPGRVNTVIEEDGTQKSDPSSTKYNYMIYLSSASRVYPSEMWIDGNPYSVDLEFVDTPVEYQDANAPQSTKKILVPASASKTIRLIAAPPIESKLTEKGKQLSSSNELVVVYKQGGKFYYSTLGKLTILEEAAMQ